MISLLRKKKFPKYAYFFVALQWCNPLKENKEDKEEKEDSKTNTNDTNTKPTLAFKNKINKNQLVSCNETQSLYPRL